MSSEISSAICKQPVVLENDRCADENGNDVHESCCASLTSPQDPPSPNTASSVGAAPRRFYRPIESLRYVRSSRVRKTVKRFFSVASSFRSRFIAQSSRISVRQGGAEDTEKWSSRLEAARITMTRFLTGYSLPCGPIGRKSLDPKPFRVLFAIRESRI
jgi:hypothetical protein